MVAGIDVGQDNLWIVIRAFYRRFAGRSYLVTARELPKDWEQLLRALVDESVNFCVIDGHYDSHAVTRFVMSATRQGIHAFKLFYRRDADYDRDWTKHTMRVDRTAAIEDTLAAFREGRHRLPANAHQLADGQYYRHLLSRVALEDPDNSLGRRTYGKTSRDDLAHAEVAITAIAEAFGQHGGWWS